MQPNPVPRNQNFSLSPQDLLLLRRANYSACIDGPARSGKGTLCEALAKETHGVIISTGIAYRFIAEIVSKSGQDPSNLSQVLKLLKDRNFCFFKFPAEDHNTVAILSGSIYRMENLRTPEIERLVPILSKNQEVRVYVNQALLSFFKHNVRDRLFFDGRDSGQLLPKATFKMYLDVSPAVAAERAVKAWNAALQKDGKEPLSESEVEIRKQITISRIQSDMQNTKLAPGAKKIDSSNLTPAEVLEQTKFYLVQAIKEKIAASSVDLRKASLRGNNLNL